MTVVVYVIGALMVLLGGVFISLGVPVVRMEIGWSEVIGGSCACSAGFVVLALGVVVQRLESVQKAVLGLSLAPAWSEPPAEPQEPAWEPAPQSGLRHPLAPAPVDPVVGPAPDTMATAMFVDEPQVLPEPILTEAPLRVETPALAPERLAQPEPQAKIRKGAPDLLPSEDFAPSIAPVEPVPPEVLDASEETVPVQPEIRSADPGRTRPNFLTTFLARRSATSSAERASRPLAPEGADRVAALQGDLAGSFAPAPTRVDLSSGWSEPEPAAPVSDVDLPPSQRAEAIEDRTSPSSGWAQESDVERVRASEEVQAAAAPVEAEPAPDEPAPPPTLDPVVVGRYNAGSASYIMYSNGMIEVETESGTHRFASMQDLKAFIARRDKAEV